MEKTTLLHLPRSTPECNINDKINHSEHTRWLLYEVLKERGIKSNSVTGEKIDEKSDIEALLQVIQIEKKKKEQGEISQVKLASNKSADMLPQKCDPLNGFWWLTYEFYKVWFSCLVLKPFTMWLGYPMYDR